MNKIVLSLLFLSYGQYLQAQFMLTDIFNRNLDGENIILVDWEGYIANPAIKLTLQPPASATFPIGVTLTANHTRLYFNNPSSVGVNGPAKFLSFNNSNSQDFYLSIFPDRGDGDETYTLTLNSSEGIQHFDIQVVDQDLANPVVDFNIIMDFSQDTSYNFFSTPAHVDIATQAANDWAYFLEDMNFDTVPALDQWTFIWEDNYASGNWTQNPATYTGFLLYNYGIHADPHISGGQPSLHAFASVSGIPTTLRRSGGYNVDPHGNFNTLGWNTGITDDTWLDGTNLGTVSNDLYSIALHEIGHVLCFNPGFPVFETYKNQGFIDDPEVMAYHGSTVPVNNSDHLSDGTLLVDRVAKQGLFGSEYAEFMPLGRWLITKLNLLVMQAIGYNIKQTSAFEPVTIISNALAVGALNISYSDFLMAGGGIPFYHFEILAGSLPNGLSLNAHTGEISGTPLQDGQFSLTIRVTDYDMETAQKVFLLDIQAPCTASLTLSNPLNVSLYEAGISITTQGMTTVLNSMNITFKAGSEINLNAEFEVSQGGIFSAEIGGCSGN